MPRLGDHPRRGGGLGLLVRMIARAHQWSGFDVAEAEAQGFVPQIAEFLRRVETGNGQVVPRGTQILAYGKNVDAAAAEIAEHLDQFCASIRPVQPSRRSSSPFQERISWRSRAE